MLWLNVRLWLPARTQSIPVEIPVFPAVTPVLETPNPLIALWLVCAVAERERVKPAELLAVVPARFVRFRVGLPWLWFDSAAVVRKAGKLRLRPELLAVMLTPLAVSAVLRPIASLEARAVVKALCEAVITEPPTPFSPKVMPLPVSKRILPAVVAVRVPASIPTPAAAPLAERESVKPAELEAVDLGHPSGWRTHPTAGILLRRDLHALLDPVLDELDGFSKAVDVERAHIGAAVRILLE